MARHVQRVEFSADTVGRDRDFICPVCGTEVHARFVSTSVRGDGNVHRYKAEHAEDATCEVTEFEWKQRGF